MSGPLRNSFQASKDVINHLVDFLHLASYTLTALTDWTDASLSLLVHKCGIATTMAKSLLTNDEVVVHVVRTVR